MHISQTELSSRLAAATEQVSVGATYSHYKNPASRYKVLQLAIIEADETVCVIYEAQYGDVLTFVRPLTSWLDQVTFDGKKIPRFTLVATE